MGDSTVTVLYLRQDQTYRLRVVPIKALWPNYLMNKTDRMAHVTEDGAIFQAGPQPRLSAWQAMVECDPLPMTPTDEVSQMLCEENAVWPMIPDPFPDPWKRLHQWDMVYQAGWQEAYVDSAIERRESFLTTAAGLTAILVAAAAFTVMAAIVVTNYFGG